jgi:nucleotide-binding universal stress UspA family protein
MVKPENIVAAIDFSESSLLAMETALNLVSESGGVLHLLHVLEVPKGIDPIGVLQPSLQELEEEALERLKELVPDNPEAGTEIVRAVMRGSPARMIAQFAKEKQAGLIVVGTHGRTGLARMLMGSTAEALLRKAPCKVLVVKS